MTKTSKTPSVVQGAFSKDEQTIVNNIIFRCKDAKNFKVTPSTRKFLNGAIYYVEFESADNDANDEESFYYAFVEKEECRLYDDPMTLIDWSSDTLEKKQTLMQRINEFELHELVASIIAILVSGAFIWLVTWSSNAPSAKEILPIFSLVLGYYFGQGKRSKN